MENVESTVTGQSPGDTKVSIMPQKAKHPGRQEWGRKLGKMSKERNLKKGARS